MTDLHDRYCSFIDSIVQLTLQGVSQTPEQVYQFFVDELEPDTAELFEDCLSQQVAQAEQIDRHPEVCSQVNAALAMIQQEWQRYQQELAAKEAIAQAMHRITSAESGDRLTAFIATLDPNQPYPLQPEQLQQLVTALRLDMGHPDRREQLQQFADGILQGLHSWRQIEPHLVTWLDPQPNLANPKITPHSPWQLWAAQAIGPLPKVVFELLQTQQSLADWAADCPEINLSNWIELVVVFQRVQQGLIVWANQQPYEDQPASRLMTSLYLGFVGTWTQFAAGLAQSTYLNSYHRDYYAASALQVGWQFLHQFARSSHFPLYGNPVVLFGQQNFRNAIQYLSQTPATSQSQTSQSQADQARVLTLVGASLRITGQYEQAIALHERALTMAQQAGDQPCVIAHLNYLSRLALFQQEWDSTIAQSQRALILARQIGDALGEENALTNLGAAAASQYQQQAAPMQAYESPLAHLMQAVEKAKLLEDQLSEALCAISLAQICLVLGHPGEALKWVQTGLQQSTVCGDVYLQSLNFTLMAQACEALHHPADAIYAACLALHHFDRLQRQEWRQPAALLTKMQGKLGERFEQLLQNELGEIIQQIGVEGFAQIPELLERFRLEEYQM